MSGPNPRAAAVAALVRQEQDGFSNLILDAELRRQKLEGRDKAFASAIFYTVLEHRGTLDYILGQFLPKGLAKLDPQVREILRAALAQARYMQVPASAAVNEAVKLTRTFKKASASGLVNAVLRRAIAYDLDTAVFSDAVERLMVLGSAGRDVAAFLHAKLRQKGVRLHLGCTVEGFAANGDRVNVLLKNEAPLTADMVVLAIGVTSDTGLAKAAGLELGIKGSILVNDRMETSAPDIYAVGDAVQVKHFVTGQDTLLSLAGPANKQGRIAADNICGGDSRYPGSQGSSVIKVFDMTIATTGVNEKTAKQAGIDCDKVYLSPMSHAGYYPGGKVMTLKVVFEKGTYRLLGAQIVGYEGVDKRIDVLATAIHAGLSALQLKDLDLAYAPPYSSAKDPVNMAGFMIENLSHGLVEQFFPEDVDALPRDGSVTLLDVRTPGEYADGHAEGFVNLPVDDLRERLREVPVGKPVYVICQSGLRSYIACRILAQQGFKCYNLSGGWRLYETVVRDRTAAQEAWPCGMEK